MSTKKNTGVRNHTPNMAPIQAGSEVTGPPSAAVPTTSTAGTTPAAGALTDVTPSELLAVEAGAKAFRESFASILATLYALLGVFPKQGKARTTAVSGQRKATAAQWAELLSEHPDITSSVTPDAISAGLAVDAALAMVKRDLQQTLPILEACGRQAANGSCSEAAVVRSAARILAVNNAVLAAKIASIDLALRRGKQVTTTADTAAKAAKAQQRAEVRAARMAAKAAKAARSAERAAQAHADNHPTTPDVVIVPAGTTTPATAPGTPNGSPPKG